MKKLLCAGTVLLLAACASTGSKEIGVKAPEEGKVRIRDIDVAAKSVVLTECDGASSGRTYRITKSETPVGTVVADSVVGGTLTGRFVGAGDEVTIEVLKKGDAVSVTEVREEAVITGGDARTQ